ncbi:MAG TPA: hypothetical protein DCM07_13590 [Planctomycetaceae bacterium]|nr:hypothetical protein [Gimesia sp.]HAH45857.1 hypothetical protein [Planctomycetaceae bacterium]HBL47161.1 hypothetical protein [Planctomycetaceae bacterium]|tara:strand:+ start:1946 stop:2155 length:210 start_codon:yes stop_codon:yes gene_type:complete
MEPDICIHPGLQSPFFRPDRFELQLFFTDYLIQRVMECVLQRPASRETLIPAEKTEQAASPIFDYSAGQ